MCVRTGQQVLWYLCAISWPRIVRFRFFFFHRATAIKKRERARSHKMLLAMCTLSAGIPHWHPVCKRTNSCHRPINICWALYRESDKLGSRRSHFRTDFSLCNCLILVPIDNSINKTSSNFTKLFFRFYSAILIAIDLPKFGSVSNEISLGLTFRVHSALFWHIPVS